MQIDQAESSASEIVENAQVNDHEPTNEELLGLLGDDEVQEQPKEAPETPQENPLSQKFAELSKMESKYQKQIRELKEKINHYEDEGSSKADPETLMSDLRKEFSKNPIKFLQEKFESSYDDISDFIVNEGSRVKEFEANEKVSSLESQIQSLQERLENKDKEEKESRLNKQVEKFKSDLSNYAESRGEEYGLVSKLGEIDTVYEVMSKYHEEHGKNLSHDEALKMVETHFEEKLKAISGLDKVKNIFNVDNGIRSELKRTQTNPSFNTNDTITNEFVSPYSEADLEELSDEERFELAKKLF